jgi:hypothetical protein
MTKHFLLVFDRGEGHLSTLREFASRGDALQARFDAERLHRDDTTIEVVVLTAPSREALRRTHARYFSDEREIARRGLEQIERAGNGRRTTPGVAV